MLLYNPSHYRKTTPIECERLQTVPDNYTSIVSNSQRYKMLGNGWTVDIPAHIFSYIAPNLPFRKRGRLERYDIRNNIY